MILSSPMSVSTSASASRSHPTLGARFSLDHGALREARAHGQKAGRQEELEYLLNRFLQASRGQRQLVFAGGEPGIGKTTLVELFLERLAGRPRTTCVVGQCAMSFGAGEAYGPVLEALGPTELATLLFDLSRKALGSREDMDVKCSR